MKTERRVSMAGRGPMVCSILPEYDRTRATCDAPAKKIENAYATRLACGIYTVMSSMYAVRKWSIDFVEQSHINNARNWIAASCHAIKETVSLEGCKCCKRYDQWGRQPAPSCSKCAKNHVRKASPGKTGTEQGGSKGKRAKCDSSGGKCERKREKIQHPREAVTKTKTS